MSRWSDPYTARAEIERLHDKHCIDRDDGSLAFTLDDDLRQMRLCAKHGLELSQWANSRGVDIKYAQALKDFVIQFPSETV